jgi:hypothetical protein
MKLKRIFAAVTAFALCASLAGCGAAATVSESAAESAAESAVEATPAVTEAPATEETADASEAALRIAGLKGPTTMGLVNLRSPPTTTSRCTALPMKSCRCWSRETWTQPLCPPTSPPRSTTRRTVQWKLPASTRWACSTSSRTERPSTLSGI